MQEALWQKNDFKDLDNCHIKIYRDYFSHQKANHFLSQLADIEWTQSEIVLFGNKHSEPRETAWYGDAGLSYSYSGIKRYAKDWIPFLEEIREEVQKVARVSFNSVLLNRYRNEKDSVSWHADDEPELGASPTIASVSFGASRKFQIREKNNKGEIFSTFLHHGDLMVMNPPTQNHWLHCVPKSRKASNQRVNLTFRKILNLNS
ncbi:MAG: alpha-ketoglutarate-dependent dioxygenase AlkB [Dehalococcoidia bacterium]|nr:alpha-ketoglutarate-dependent dioxygenase AlkB [Dehalococcoidia bacterium]